VHEIGHTLLGAMSRKRPRETWRLADLLPEGAPGGIFDETSVAYTVVHCADLEYRMQLIMQQLVGQAALNKALMTLGLPPRESFHAAIESASRENVITLRQARYLRGLNARANEGKHLPLIDEGDGGERGSSGGDAGGGSSGGDTGGGGGCSSAQAGASSGGERQPAA